MSTSECNNLKYRYAFSVLPILLLIALQTSAQETQSSDSTEKKSLTRKAFKEGLKLISTTPKDTVEGEKSINPFLEHSGKIIRHISIERVGFEKSIYDSARKVDKFVTRAANFLHQDTREKTVRQHLFISENKPLNPHRLADNERFLRDRDFILDCRIIAVPVPNSDSVDLLVITRDVFSLGATIGGSFPTAPEIGIYDANFDGRAQRLEFNTLVDVDRTPNFGYAFLYRKSSLLGSLANLELQYTQLNNGRSFGQENEFAWVARLNRPLVSPYSRMAGGFEMSQNWSQNVYSKPDTAFLSYRYNIFDSWLGYNIGINKEVNDRSRHFLSIRYFDGTYLDQPDQPEYKEDKDYNTAVGYLSEFTFYRQDYYKTRYIFGFGRTEDVPYGISLGITGGYVKLLSLGRPYGALKFNFGKANKDGDFYRLSFQAGAYARNNDVEDIVLQPGASYVTKLIQLNKLKARGYVAATYTQIFNHTINDLLTIGRRDIPGFSLDSLDADQRLSVHGESVLFLPRSLFGFRFAPFVALDMVYVSNCATCEAPKNNFIGISGGIRTRNENLIFGTMEVKFTFIPQDGYGDSKFVIGFKENIRVKNSGSFVKPPSLISYN